MTGAASPLDLAAGLVERAVGAGADAADATPRSATPRSP